MELLIKDLKKTFGEKVAVDIPELIVRSGEMLGIVGNNGAGKSTLFRLILDLVKADKGNVRMAGIGKNGEVFDIDVARTEIWKDWTGAFIDDSFLIDYLTPDEYFHFIASLTDTSQEQLQAFLGQFSYFMAGELCGRNKLIRTLSAGNKQKVGIMAAMLLHPQLLILDEPFNFLDPSSQNAMKHMLLDYNKTTHATILISSHNLQHTADISSRIILLEKGKPIANINNTDKKAYSILENYFCLKETSGEHASQRID